MNLSNKTLVEINSFTFQVGPTYGRKMMSGYVRSKGLTLSGKQVSRSLRRVNPVSHARRTEDTVRRRNPVPYYAPYHGNKLHCDQNEKLGMYGCTFYALSDGCSARIVKLFSMPKKNAVIIYAHFRFVDRDLWPVSRGIPWLYQRFFFPRYKLICLATPFSWILKKNFLWYPGYSWE